MEEHCRLASALLLRVVTAPLILAISLSSYAFFRRSAGQQRLDGRSHGIAEISGFSELSLTLRSLQTELVTVMRMVHLDKTALRRGKSLFGCAMRFNFSHGKNFLSE